MEFIFAEEQPQDDYAAELAGNSYVFYLPFYECLGFNFLMS